MTHLIRKRRTRQHIIADLSINYVERQALRCGFSVERLVHDYGLDLEILTFSRNGEVQEGKIAVQVKASDRFPARSRKATKATIAFEFDRRDLVSWLAEPLPVILAVYDARRDVGYWLYVQGHFKREDFNLFEAGATITVHLPTANVLDAAAMRRFARYKNRILAQMRDLVHEEE